MGSFDIVSRGVCRINYFLNRGDDDNVPVWHSRESFSVVKTWSLIHGVASNITYDSSFRPSTFISQLQFHRMREDKGQGHWYPTVLNNDQVQEFIEQHTQKHTGINGSKPLSPFTLTVFRPEESGSLNGWKIEEVNCPGRYDHI